jgi:glycerophosphoryl diester phosphodiesterase
VSAGRPWPYPRVLAHRGGGTLAPENTLAAIRVGLAHGFRAVEFDAMLPAGESPVLMHDATLARTAGRDGAVADFTADELGRFDVGRWHSPRFAGECVPTLAAALALCRANDVWPNVEIKPVPGREALTGRVVAQTVARAYQDLVRAGGARREGAVAAVPLLSSFSAEALAAARDAAPDVPRGWLTERVPPAWREQLAALGAVALHTDHRQLTAAQAADLKKGGAWLFCYTVNEAARARELFAWGVDALCTDRIDLIGPDPASGR